MRENIISRESCCLRCRRNVERKGTEGPGGLKARAISTNYREGRPQPKACVTLSLIKLSSPPGNEVTRALITRRLIANYERTWSASAIFNFSRAS